MNLEHIAKSCAKSMVYKSIVEVTAVLNKSRYCSVIRA
jgi:hypothetical protein